MKPLGILMLLVAVLNVKPDGVGAKTMLEQYGFRCWLFIALAWVVYVIFTVYRESLSQPDSSRRGSHGGIVE